MMTIPRLTTSAVCDVESDKKLHDMIIVKANKKFMELTLNVI